MIKSAFKAAKNKKFTYEKFVFDTLGLLHKYKILNINTEEIEDVIESDLLFLDHIFPRLQSINSNYTNNFNLGHEVGPCLSLGIDFSKLKNNKSCINSYFNEKNLQKILNVTDRFILCNFIE